jgi:hypothetical protein
VFIGGWVGVDLTRQGRRQVERGYQALHITNLWTLASNYREVFVESTNPKDRKVEHCIIEARYYYAVNC